MRYDAKGKENIYGMNIKKGWTNNWTSQYSIWWISYIQNWKVTKIPFHEKNSSYIYRVRTFRVSKKHFFLPKMINSGSEWLGPIHEKCCTVKRCSALFPSVSFCSKNDIYHYEKKVFLAMKWHCRFFSSMYERNFFNNFDFWIQTKWKLATANTQCISKNIVIYPTSMYWCHCQVFTLYLFYFYSITGTNVNEMWNI